MKTKILILAVLILPITALGQISQKNVINKVSEVKVTNPIFTGIQFLPGESGSQADLFDKYLVENFEYPENAAKCGDQGTGVVQFIVQSNGKLTDFHVINSICGELDDEFIRVIKTTDGKWKPGENNGNPVPMPKEVSMMFIADCEKCGNQPKEYFTKIATVKYDKGNKALFEKHKVRKAMRFFSDGITYLPYDKSLLLMRGICRYEIGDRDGAMEDWTRLSGLGCDIDMSEYAEILQGMKGYDKLTTIMNNAMP